MKTQTMNMFAETNEDMPIISGMARTEVVEPKRTNQPTVKAITTATLVIERGDNQFFCRTPRSWELWQAEPLMRLQRWSLDRVFWVIEE